MTMTYNLWDAEVGKYLGRYTSEDEALGVVRSLVDHYGDHYAESLSLGRVADDGTILEPITGPDLAARARTVTKRPAADIRRPAVIASHHRHTGTHALAGKAGRFVERASAWSARQVRGKSSAHKPRQTKKPD